MTTKELVQLHDQQKERYGVLHLTKIFTRRMFREHLNGSADQNAPATNSAGHGAWKNHVFGNQKRAYGDYLFHQDRDLFEDNYRVWLLEKREAA